MVSRTLFADPANPFCRRFVGRLFSVPEVESLTIDRAGAEICYAPGRATLPEVVRRIAGALGKHGSGGVRTDSLCLSPPPGAPLCVRRYGDVLSTWEVRHSLPGRLRVRHPGLRRRRGVADALVSALSGVTGVLACRIGLYTGSVLVLHDPRIGRDELLQLCESVIGRAEARDADPPGLARFGAGGALLGLAVAGHFVSTPLLAASAALLVAGNVNTFRRACKALRARSLDTDGIYSALLVLTVLSGDILSIAVMAWSIAVWPLLLERRLTITRHALAAGEPRRVARAKLDAVATEIRRRLIESARLEPLSTALGGRAVPPGLAPSVRRAMRSGLGMTTFALAPNYADPGLGTPLDRSATLLACADAGFLVRGEPALARLADVDAVVIDADSDEPGVAELVTGLRARGIERILLAPPVNGADTARSLRRLRAKGFMVALIGHGDDLAAAREADVAIALGGPHLPPVEAADIVLGSAHLEGALDLLDRARNHAREARLSRHLGLWPTLVAAGGAFTLGFPTLQCVLLTNVGALAVYWRGSRRLTEAEAAWRPDRP